MRKVAGKCVALFMALLMLLSSMPLTALAEAQTNTSAPITVQAQPRVESNAVELPATAAEAAQDAAEDNVSSGEYVSLGPVSVSGVTVENGTNYAQTGATFTYTIPYYFDPAPSYRDPESDSPVPAYDTYTDVKITVSAPDGFVLLVDGAEHRSYTFTLAD